jgi:hypothetical protein
LRIWEEMFEKKMWVGLDLLERKFWRNELNQKVRDEEVKWKGRFVSLVVDAWAYHKHEIFASKLSPSSLFNTSVFWCVCACFGLSFVTLYANQHFSWNFSLLVMPTKPKWIFIIVSKSTFLSKTFTILVICTKPN